MSGTNLHIGLREGVEPSPTRSQHAMLTVTPPKTQRTSRDLNPEPLGILPPLADKGPSHLPDCGSSPKPAEGFAPTLTPYKSVVLLLTPSRQMRMRRIELPLFGL